MNNNMNEDFQHFVTSDCHIQDNSILILVGGVWVGNTIVNCS
jgi:hypothetical protein